MAGTPLILSNSIFSPCPSDVSIPKRDIQSESIFHGAFSEGISSTLFDLEELHMDNSPLPHKPSFLELRHHDNVNMAFESGDDKDVAMESATPTDTEKKSYDSKILDNSRFSLPPEPSSLSEVSISSYFTCPKGSLAQPQNVIPTKKLHLKSSRSPSTTSLINSKPTLSWIPVKELGSTPCGPSKATIYNSFDSSAPQTLISNEEQHRQSRTTPSHYTSPSSWAMPSFRGGELAGFDSPTIKHFIPKAAPTFPRNCKVRRTHSMYEHPEYLLADGMKASELTKDVAAVVGSPSTPQQETISILNMPNCPIKTLTVKEDQFKRIDRDTLCEIMDGLYSKIYDKFMIIDCRFEYEYDGGHIQGAININNKERLEKVLLSQSLPNEKVLLIFHCEYSAHRGPRMAMHLRNLDRQRNINRYPYLDYPDIAILSGGYSQFFSEYHSRCFPQKYVGMNDTSYQLACEKEMSRFKRDMRFTRTQSFTFPISRNESSLGLESSPLVNASKSYSCLEFSNIHPGQTTPTCNQFRRLGVKGYVR